MVIGFGTPKKRSIKKTTAKKNVANKTIPIRSRDGKKLAGSVSLGGKQAPKAKSQGKKDSKLSEKLNKDTPSTQLDLVSELDEIKTSEYWLRRIESIADCTPSQAKDIEDFLDQYSSLNWDKCTEEEFDLALRRARRSLKLD